MQNQELHVIFGTGPLGKWTARDLVQQGKRVRMVNRSGKTQGLPLQAELMASDAYDAARNIELTRGAETVYQCAQPEYHEWEAKFPPLQEAILQAAMANGSRFVVAENIYMYGEPQGQSLTEDSRHNAHTKKGKVRAAMTERIFELVHAGKLQAAAVRASDFFGPDDPIYAGLFFRPALEGKQVQMIGRMDVPHTWTFAPDFGRALAIVGTHDEAMGQAWHVPSDTAITQQQLVDLIGEQVGRPVKVLTANKLMLRGLGLFVPSLREIVEMYYEFDKPFVMDSSKFTQTFGMQPTPLREAVRQTVEWVKLQAPDRKASTGARAETARQGG